MFFFDSVCHNQFSIANRQSRFYIQHCAKVQIVAECFHFLPIFLKSQLRILYLVCPLILILIIGVFSFSSKFFKISVANPILGLPAHFGFDHWSVFIFFQFFKYPDCESFVFSTCPFIQDQLRFPIVAVQTPADIYQRGYQLASLLLFFKCDPQSNKNSLTVSTKIQNRPNDPRTKE